ncbi:MAG: MFS transporter [Gemmatimonadetes bacterium]|nr:MFS transporter [Gemmatimonadota bacterium]MBT6145953.1 MFS transporter [Gemmatimonadota bacterium]MBT7861553.1 MFS transporter [Gemmatimonadota bacterium]
MPPRRKTLAVGGFAHFVHDGFTDCIYVLLPLWAAAYALTHAEVGALKMVMAGTLAATQVPAGLLAERWGERIVLAIGTALAGTGFILLGWAGGFLTLAVCLAVAGMGCGTQHPLASSVISRAYAGPSRRAALGTYNFTGDLGKVAAPAAVGASAAIFGWPASTMGYGLFAVAAAFVVYALLPQAERATSASMETPDKTNTPGGWGIIDRRGYATLASIGMIDSGVRLGFLTFLPFLLLEKGGEVTTLGLSLALVFAGGAAGKLVCGLIADRVGILRTVIITEVATGALMASILLLPLGQILIVLPMLGVALNGTSSVLYGTVGDFVDGDRQARAYGLYYTLGIGAGAMSPMLFGAVSDLRGVTVALAVIAVCVLLILPLCAVLRPSLNAALARDGETASR